MIHNYIFYGLILYRTNCMFTAGCHMAKFQISDSVSRNPMHDASQITIYYEVSVTYGNAAFLSILIFIIG